MKSVVETIAGIVCGLRVIYIDCAARDHTRRTTDVTHRAVHPNRASLALSVKWLRFMSCIFDTFWWYNHLREHQPFAIKGKSRFYP